MSPHIFFESWSGVARVALIGTAAYVSLIVLLRISGKRTLSKMNAFDLIVTVAFGSILATVLLSKDVALAEGVTAFALLIGLQFTVTWLSVRFDTVDKLVKAEPSMLYFRGQLLHQVMCRERVTERELHAAARSQGNGTLEEVEAVVLETDGTLTLITKLPSPDNEQGHTSTLTDVTNYPPE